MDGRPNRPMLARRGKSPPTNLPVVRDRLIGRERELTLARGLLLRDDVGLLTLTGAGGTGKTRLAIDLARGALDHFDDGAFFVALAPLRDSALVAATIAEALGLQGSAGRSPETAVQALLRDRRLLLILDNFEHVLGAAPLVGELLSAAPGLTVVVTSRAPLHIRGEHEVPVAPLALPDLRHLPSLDALARYGAIALFVRRARAIRPDFALTDETAEAVAEICCRLDGLPLAIELAAARTRTLSLPAMVGRLERRLPLLTGGARDLPQRQRTLRDTIAWSYDLLDEDERRLLRRLAVFVGGCVLEAAECVAGGMARSAVYGARDGEPATSGEPAAPDALLDVLESLVSKCLLVREEVGSTPRFGMLETIREYALEQLVASGEEGEARRRHAEYFVQLAEEADPKLRGPDQQAWLARLEADHDNFRAVLPWTLADGSRAGLGQRLAVALGWFWVMHSHFTEGSRWFDRALSVSTGVTASTRAKLFLGAGRLTHYRGDQERARRLLEEGLALFRVLADGEGAGSSLSTLGLVAVSQGDLGRAAEVLSESIDVRRTSGDNRGVGLSLINLGRVRLGQGDLDGAMRVVGEGIAICRAAGDLWSASVGLGRLSSAAEARGDLDLALAISRENLRLCQELDNRRSVARALQSMSVGASAGGDYVRAARLLGAVEELLAQIGAAHYPEERAHFERQLAAVRAAIGDDALAMAWREGRTMSFEQAVEYALSPTEPVLPGRRKAGRSTNGTRSDPLSEREREIAALIARGCSNRHIAQTLTISERTAEVHARNIREKLGLSSRTQIAAWAVEYGL